jgi:hypothetical protein
MKDKDVKVTAAYRLIARQRPQNKQWVQPLLCIRRINKEPFWAAAPLTHPHENEYVCNNRLNVGNRMFSMWSAPRTYKEEIWVNHSVELLREAEKRWRYSWVDSWQEFCMDGCDMRTWAHEAEDTAGWKRLRRCAVVICEVWKSAIAM